MKQWSVQDAKAHFSELLRASLTQGPQLVTKHGADAAVLVPVEEWLRLTQRSRPGLKTLLLAPEARADLPIPERGQLRRRMPRQDA